MTYRNVILNHDYANRQFDGTQITVSEIAIYLLEKAMRDLRTMPAWQDKKDDEIIHMESLSRYMHDLGNSPALVGVRIPIEGPAMRLRCESFGSYTMNGTFWLSGFKRGIFESKEDLGCGEGTLDQLHQRVQEEIEGLKKESEYAALPSYRDLELRSGPARKPHGWYSATLKRPNGDLFDFGDIIWPHANESALEIAVQKILLTAVCLYVRRDSMDPLYERTKRDITEILGNIALESFKEVDFQGGGNAPPLHSNIVTYHAAIKTKDQFLRPQETIYKATVNRHSGKDIYDDLKKIVKSQKRRQARTQITVSRPALLLAKQTNNLVVLFEHFDTRQMFGSPEQSYKIEDGQIDYSGFLDDVQKVSYERGIVRIQDMDLPDAILEACRGKPARDVIDHPALDGSTVKKARRLKQQVAIYLDTPFLTKEECEKELSKDLGLAA